MKTLLLSLLLLIGCASSPLDNALWSAVQNALPGVQADVERGVIAAFEAGEISSNIALDLSREMDALGVAIKAADVSTIRSLPWADKLRPLAVRGAMEYSAKHMIDQGRPPRRYERIDNFTEAIAVLAFGKRLASPRAGWPMLEQPSTDPYYWDNKVRRRVGAPLLEAK